MTKKAIEIVENYTSWNTKDVENFCNEFVRRAEKMAQRDPWMTTGDKKNRTCKVTIFDWPQGSYEQWVRGSSTIGVSEDAQFIYDELQMAPPVALAKDPMEVVALKMGNFDVPGDLYVAIGYRIYNMLHYERAITTPHGTQPVTDSMVADGFRIQFDTPKPNAKVLELGRLIRSERRRVALKQALQRDIVVFGEKYYDRYMDSMTRKIEAVRASHKKKGFPVETLDGLKAQLQQDLEWLNSITSDVAKIERPQPTYGRK